MSEEQAQQMLQQMQMLENMYAEMSQKENSIKNIMRDADSAIKSIQEQWGEGWLSTNACVLTKNYSTSAALVEYNSYLYAAEMLAIYLWI